MARNGRWLGRLALAGMLVTGAAACADDTDGDVATDEVAEETTTTEATDGGDEGTDGTVDLGDIEGLSEECAVFAEAAAAFGAAFGGGEDADFGSIADAMREFADEAPEEIRDDVDVLADAYEEFADAVGDIDLSDPEVIADPDTASRIAEAGEIFTSAEVSEASDNLTAYTEEHCA